MPLGSVGLALTAHYVVNLATFASQVYDIHTLQNRFYLTGNCIAQLESTIPLLLEAIKGSDVDAIAFPDDGAAKRFGGMFDGREIIVCGKVRDGDRRIVTVQDGRPEAARHVLVVDDLVQSGGTLFECSEVPLPG